MAAALLGGGITLGSYLLLTKQQRQAIILYEANTPQQSIHLANLPNGSITASEPDLVHAAQIATPAVVHIEAQYDAKVVQRPRAITPFDQLFREFFGENFDTGPRE